MAPLDITHLPDISDAEPAGENLEFDAEFIELERLAQGKPEQQYGSTIVPAEEPEWKDVLASARALTGRTHDLRVMGHLAVARLHREGFAGYVEVLGQVRDVLETRWGPVHPQLDPEDDNDPTLRANALLMLTEPARVLRVLRTLPLARSQRAGTVSWRDISIFNGTLEVPEGTPKMTEGVIAAAFRETDPAEVFALRAALDQATAHAKAIPEVFNDQAGFGTGPDYTELLKQLREMGRMVDTYAIPVAVEDEPAEVLPEPGDGTAPVAAVPRSAPVMSIATMGPPTNRTDAIRLLELVVQYYERSEPGSPLPLLLGRARRLADMNFMDILREMAPDGLNQAEIVVGRPPEGYG